MVRHARDTRGHRCPCEDVTIGLLETRTVRLARPDHTVSEQNPTIALHQVPNRPHSGFLTAIGPRPFVRP